MKVVNILKSYIKEAFSKKALVDVSKQFLTLFGLAIGGLCWVGFVVYIALLPAIFGIEINESLGVFLMLIGLFSPIFLYLFINKKRREEFLKEGKNFAIGIWTIIKALAYLILILGGIILFFVIVGGIFSWLAGLGVATLLAIIIIIILLK